MDSGHLCGDMGSQNMDVEDQQGQQPAVAMGEGKVVEEGEDVEEQLVVGEQLVVVEEPTVGKDVRQTIHMVNQIGSVNVSRGNLSSVREGTNQHEDEMESEQSTFRMYVAHGVAVKSRDLGRSRRRINLTTTTIPLVRTSVGRWTVQDIDFPSEGRRTIWIGLAQVFV